MASSLISRTQSPAQSQDRPGGCQIAILLPPRVHGFCTRESSAVSSCQTDSKDPVKTISTRRRSEAGGFRHGPHHRKKDGLPRFHFFPAKGAVKQVMASIAVSQHSSVTLLSHDARRAGRLCSQPTWAVIRGRTTGTTSS